MSNNVTEKNEPANLDDDKSGYPPPPPPFRFGEGLPENPFGRRRPKAQRNLPAVLTEVLLQTVLVKQDNKSVRMTKGEAVIKTLMSMAQNGDHPAIAAISTLAEKIGRVDDNINSKTGGRVGIMLVPGVAASLEDWQKEIAKRPARLEAREKLLKEDARILRKWEAERLAFISEHQGTPEGNFAVAQLDKLKSSSRYQTNYFLWYPPKEEVATDPPKEAPPAKLPWDADEWVRLPFSARKEYMRTHSEDVKPKPQPE
jgi:hypothetical protein